MRTTSARRMMALCVAVLLALALAQCASFPESDFAWPVARQRGILVAAFGETLDPNKPGATYDNTGIDIDWSDQVAAVAAREGRVLSIVKDLDPALGYSVLLEHADGLQTRYAHLQRVSVRAGQRVRREQRLGTLGANTPPFKGFRLHFEVLHSGVPIDPLGLFQDQQTPST